MRGMETINDFCKWIGSQKRAAAALALTESQVSRLCNGRTRVTPEVAERAEAYSLGLFRKERLVWPEKSA
jgi:plasmid maintenance system antidote protein VapI